jgi:lipid-binding SYLF domain-containing protein
MRCSARRSSWEGTSASPPVRWVAGAGSNITADVISFARAKGVYAGISLEGAVIAPDGKANEAFYGKPASPVDILVRRNVESPSSLSLRQTLGRG